MNNDPRGPVRTITSVNFTAEITYLTLSCGHINTANQIFHYKVGNDSRCMKCRSNVLPDEKTAQRAA